MGCITSFIRCDKIPWPKAMLGRKGLPVAVFNKEKQGRNSRQEPGKKWKREWMNAVYWLAPHGLLFLHFYTTQDYLLRVLPSRVGGIHSHQLSIRMLQRSSQPGGVEFIEWGSLFRILLISIVLKNKKQTNSNNKNKNEHTSYSDVCYFSYCPLC